MFEQLFGVAFIVVSGIIWAVMRGAEYVQYIRMTAWK